MNKRHLKNLTKLANFLENEVTDKHFDIEAWRQDGRGYKNFNSKADCGSIGCAIGWAPFAFKSKYSNTPKTTAYEWDKFSKILFNLESYQEKWQWCFSGLWKYSMRQKTRRGTIRRIRRLVKNKGEMTKDMHKLMGLYL